MREERDGDIDSGDREGEIEVEKEGERGEKESENICQINLFVYSNVI